MHDYKPHKDGMPNKNQLEEPYPSVLETYPLIAIKNFKMNNTYYVLWAHVCIGFLSSQ